MKRMVSVFLALMIFVVSGTAFAGANPLVYRVEAENGSAIYLFGTIHAVKRDIFESDPPFGAALEEAYGYADILAVEFDIYSAMRDPAVLAETMAEMMYSDGTKATDHGASEELLNAVAEKVGVPASLLNGMKLSSWFSFLLLPNLTALDMQADNGADMWLLARAHEEGKQIHELESLDEQEAALNAITDRLAVYMIEESMADPEAEIEALRQMNDAWEVGDAESLKEVLDESVSTEGMEEALALDAQAYNAALTGTRDDDFFRDAVGYLERGEKALIAIGAAHIVGETGIAGRLMEAGYTVTDVRIP